jgi:hypothetical protein
MSRVQSVSDLRYIKNGFDANTAGGSGGSDVKDKLAASAALGGFEILLDKVRETRQRKIAQLKFTRVPPTRFARDAIADPTRTAGLRSSGSGKPKRKPLIFQGCRVCAAPL